MTGSRNTDVKDCISCNHSWTKDPNHCDSATCLCACWRKRDYPNYPEAIPN